MAYGPVYPRANRPATARAGPGQKKARRAEPVRAGPYGLGPGGLRANRSARRALQKFLFFEKSVNTRRLFL
jgi:hypothetical protein